MPGSAIQQVPEPCDLSQEAGNGGAGRGDEFGVDIPALVADVDVARLLMAAMDALHGIVLSELRCEVPGRCWSLLSVGVEEQEVGNP